MSFLKQVFLSLIVVAAAVAAWISYVPSSIPWLERAGLFEMLGIAVPQAAEAQRGGGFRRGTPSVVVAEVILRRQSDQISAIGDGRALRSVALRAEVAGRISTLDVSPGEYVEAGAQLLRLDDSVERIALERARLMQANAESELARVDALTGTGSVTAVREQEARLAMETAGLALQQAEFELSQKTIRAPISGWVGLIELGEGDRITAQESVAVITDRSRILVDFHVPERVIGQLRTGQPFWAEPLAHRGLVLEGTISAIDNVVDRTSRTLRVQGALDNGDDLLREGMAFSVLMRFAGGDYPAVPPLAVQWSSEGSFVWVVNDGKVMRVPVAIRQRNADFVLVEADLAEGMKVVVEGVQTLRPGAEVEVTSRITDLPETAGLQPVKL